MKLKLIIILCLLLPALSSFSQIKRVEIGVDGLTCSQCTRSTEISIKKLDFVKGVQMDLTHTNGIITFHENSSIYFEKIAQAVVNAGFSVRYMKVTIVLNDNEITNGSCLSHAGIHYRFVNIKRQTIHGEVTLTLLGNEYLPRKEAKQWKGLLEGGCTTAPEGHYYFVTL